MPGFELREQDLVLVDTFALREVIDAIVFKYRTGTP